VILCVLGVAAAAFTDEVLINSPQDVHRVYTETYNAIRAEENEAGGLGFLGTMLGGLYAKRAQEIAERLQLTPKRKGYLLQDEAHTLLIANGDDASELSAIACGAACADPSNTGRDNNGALDITGGRSSELVASQRHMMEARGVEVADKVSFMRI
jgi:hypothetical protein